MTAPASGYDNTPLTISWTVTNSGQYPASGSWVDQVYLDPVGGPQSTTPADSVTFTGTVNAGQSYTQTDTISSPSTVGQYIVRVVTDSGQSVQELSFTNNTGIAGQPLQRPGGVHRDGHAVRDDRVHRDADRALRRRDPDQRRRPGRRCARGRPDPGRRHDAHADGHDRRERQLQRHLPAAAGRGGRLLGHRRRPGRHQPRGAGAVRDRRHDGLAGHRRM